MNLLDVYTVCTFKMEHLDRNKPHFFVIVQEGRTGIRLENLNVKGYDIAFRMNIERFL